VPVIPPTVPVISPTVLQAIPAAITDDPPEDFYADADGGISINGYPVATAGLPVAPGAVIPAAGIALSLAMLVSRFGAPMGRVLWGFLSRLPRSAGGLVALAGTAWRAIPSWVKWALALIGLSEGSQVLLEGGGNGAVPGLDLIPGPGIPVEGGVMGLGETVVGSWNTCPDAPEYGVTFYRLSSGRIAVVNKQGRLRIWKPKSPVVLYSNPKDLQDVFAADRIIKRQAKKIDRLTSKPGYTKIVYREKRKK